MGNSGCVALVQLLALAQAQPPAQPNTKAELLREAAEGGEQLLRAGEELLSGLVLEVALRCAVPLMCAVMEAEEQNAVHKVFPLEKAHGDAMVLSLRDEEGERDLDVLAQKKSVAQLDVEAEAQLQGETLPEATRNRSEMLDDAVRKPETLPLAQLNARGVKLLLSVRDGEDVAHFVPVGMRLAHAEEETLMDEMGQGVAVAQSIAVGGVERVLLVVKVALVMGEANSVSHRMGLTE